MTMRATAVRFDAAKMYVDLDTGGKMTMLLDACPELRDAKTSDKRAIDIQKDRIRWPMLGIELSLEGIRDGVAVPPGQTREDAPAKKPGRARAAPAMKLEGVLERRMATGEPFTLLQAQEIEPGMEGRLADRAIQRWRKAGWLTFERKNGVWWRLTPDGTAAADLAHLAESPETSAPALGDSPEEDQTCGHDVDAGDDAFSGRRQASG